MLNSYAEQRNTYRDISNSAKVASRAAFEALELVVKIHFSMDTDKYTEDLHKVIDKAELAMYESEAVMYESQQQYDKYDTLYCQLKDFCTYNEVQQQQEDEECSIECYLYRLNVRLQKLLYEQAAWDNEAYDYDRTELEYVLEEIKECEKELEWSKYSYRELVE